MRISRLVEYITANKAPVKKIELELGEWFEVFEALCAMGIVTSFGQKEIEFFTTYTNAPVEVIETYITIIKTA